MGEKILVVDDDASLRRVLEYNLAKEGYAVLTADSGERALALLEAGRVDLSSPTSRCREWTAWTCCGA